MAVFRKFKGPPKGTSVHGTTSFDVFCVKSQFRGVGCSLIEEPLEKTYKKLVTPRGTAKSRISEAETPEPIVTKLYMPGAIQDIITSANFCQDRLRSFGVARDRSLAFPLTCFVVFKTLSHYRASVWSHYLAQQTLRLISVLSVLFYWLNLSLDSIKMMCGCSSQVAMLDVYAAILDNSVKTLTPFIDTVINETLWEFLPFGDSPLASVLPPSWNVVGGRLVAKEHPK